VPRQAFFGDPALDDDLPAVNEIFWDSLIDHIERDALLQPRNILDVGCHTGGLLLKLARRFQPEALYGIDPIESVRTFAAQRLATAAPQVRLLNPTEWDAVPGGALDLVVSHEMLYLEPDIGAFMKRVRRVLTSSGAGYLVLGCHAENPLWRVWKEPLIAAGHRVFDHLPLDIMAAASSSGFLPSVQPLRRSGWVTYDPHHAEFPYPDVRTMLEHHYRFKLIFRLQISNG
jgi:SAM-dependent methyltransferase